MTNVRSIGVVVLSLILSTVLVVPGASAKRLIEPHGGRHTFSQQTVSPQLSGPVVVNPLPSDPQRPTASLVGDLNNDGRVSVADLVLLQRAFSAGTVRSYGTQADLYRDGYYTLRDQYVLRMYIVGSIHTLPMIPGDVTDNGVVDVADVVKALRFYEELETPTAAQFIATDIYVNEYIQQSDVDRMLQIAVGLETGPQYENLALECFTSSEEIGEDEGAALVCKYTSQNITTMYGEELQCQITGGDGGLDTDPVDNNSLATSVMMEAVSAQTRGAGLGWQWCQFESEDTIAGDDTISMSVTNLTRATLPSARVAVTVSDDREGTVTQMEVEAISHDLYPATRGTSVVVMARDNDGNGVAGLAVSGNMPNEFGLVRTNPTTLENMRIDRPMVELADGAYFFDTSATILDGMGMVEVELYDASSRLWADIELPFNIINNR